MVVENADVMNLPPGTDSIATVFGGSGFLGRSVVKLLARQGFVVRIPVRDPEQVLKLKTTGAVGQIVPLYTSLGRQTTEEAGDIARAIDGASLVVNLVGILAEARKGDFHRIHVEAARAIAGEAARAGVAALVHVSALGADMASPSLYGRTKAEGEQAVRAAMPSAAILRPSIVFGPEDTFFNRFAVLAARAPFMPVVAGDAAMQPVYVEDVARAVLAAAGHGRGLTFELGGPEVLTFRQILERILLMTDRHKRLVNIPDWLARLLAQAGEWLPGHPLTRDQLAMLSMDNVVSGQAKTLETLGITATPIDLTVPRYLARYRPGGRRRAGVGRAVNNIHSL